MTKSEKTAEARRRFNCPKCHQPAGKPCRKTVSYTSTWHIGSPMKGIHAERLELADRFPEEKS